MALSIEEAACDALACHLRRELADVRELKVSSDWVGNAKVLPPRAISVITAGDRQDEFSDPEVVGREDLTPTRALYTWRIGDLVQPLQLDVWTLSRAHRADLVRRLAAPLNRGLSIIDPTADPISAGVTLPLGHGYDGYGSFLFDRVDSADSADVTQQSEFRAMCRGQVRCVVTIKHESPRLTRAQLSMALNGNPLRELSPFFP